MVILRLGDGVTDIRGGQKGVYYHRDKSGLHQTAKPRRVHQRTAAQAKQRDAFRKARRYTKDPRWVSYYIYRALLDLPFIFDLTASGNPSPDSKGIYILGGQAYGQNWYHRADDEWYLWCKVPPHIWIISTVLGVYGTHFWATTNGLISTYVPYEEATGQVKLTWELVPPPPDYTIP